MTDKKTVLCFGLGFTARELARQNPNWNFIGTKRDVTAAGETLPPNVTLKPFEGEAFPIWWDEVADTITHVLLSIPPSGEGDPVFLTMSEALVTLNSLEWVGYLSTTGVYGNLNGGEATEETPRNASGPRGQRRVDAEMAWEDLHARNGLPLHIFRLPGIYGPGRNQLVSLQKGKAHRIVKKDHVFSRIHVEDIAAILSASMKQPNPGRIYNIADDNPAPPQDVVAYAAELLGIEAPPLQDFETANLSPMARSFYNDNKTVSNKRIKDELGISLRFPTYKEGLKALSEAL
ncbi:NAD-dependent epimerase/dehydratase family protein [Sneathiella sp. P13V-1]|uniref:SDR family oxidoreductase n=1 Tax=Sneathiella sp. P13V-1 TaxID=2697366 RepID=UPI00187BA330|nr:SDR family oxidoreductase [Sneathiella sp. P13V-1]MBE7635712.1 NAD-dependent epimerase/dehydratase family protein [Sneathiella sp. P13V-1]